MALRNRRGGASPRRAQSSLHVAAAEPEPHDVEPERVQAVSFLLHRERPRFAMRVRYCSRARLGLYPCNLPPFCRQCTGAAKLRYEDRVMAMCTFALADNTFVIILASDFTVGETESLEEGVRWVKVVLSDMQRKPAKTWSRIIGVIYTIEVGRSRRGKWWVHIHTFLAIDARNQPLRLQSLGKAWARRVRSLRWPDQPFDPRNESDTLYRRLIKSQCIKPLHAYAWSAASHRLVPIESVQGIEADVRARARYLRERKGEPGNERVVALTRLSNTDRLAIIDLRARLNGRSGLFRNHSERKIVAVARRLRDRRLADLSRRRLLSRNAPANARLIVAAPRRVIPSSPQFRARLRSHFSGRS